MYIVVRTKPRKKFSAIEDLCRINFVDSGNHHERIGCDEEARELANKYRDRYTYWTIMIPSHGRPKAVSRNGRSYREM